MGFNSAFKGLKLMYPDSQENRTAANATVGTFHAELSNVVVKAASVV